MMMTLEFTKCGKKKMLAVIGVLAAMQTAYAAAPRRGLPVGIQVRIKGVTENTFLNGQVGTVASSAKTEDAYNVKLKLLDGTSRMFTFRSQNLELPGSQSPLVPDPSYNHFPHSITPGTQVRLLDCNDLKSVCGVVESKHGGKWRVRLASGEQELVNEDNLEPLCPPGGKWYKLKWDEMDINNVLLKQFKGKTHIKWVGHSSMNMDQFKVTSSINTKEVDGGLYLEQPEEITDGYVKLMQSLRYNIGDWVISTASEKRLDGKVYFSKLQTGRVVDYHFKSKKDNRVKTEAMYTIRPVIVWRTATGEHDRDGFEKGEIESVPSKYWNKLDKIKKEWNPFGKYPDRKGDEINISVLEQKYQIWSIEQEIISSQKRSHRNMSRENELLYQLKEKIYVLTAKIEKDRRIMRSDQDALGTSDTNPHEKQKLKEFEQRELALQKAEKRLQKMQKETNDLPKTRFYFHGYYWPRFEVGQEVSVIKNYKDESGNIVLKRGKTATITKVTEAGDQKAEYTVEVEYQKGKSCRLNISDDLSTYPWQYLAPLPVPETKTERRRLFRNDTADRLHRETLRAAGNA